jgi:hypothetical protein
MAAFATYVVAGDAAQGIRDGLSRAPHIWLIEAARAYHRLPRFSLFGFETITAQGSLLPCKCR